MTELIFFNTTCNGFWFS